MLKLHLPANTRRTMLSAMQQDGLRRQSGFCRIHRAGEVKFFPSKSRFSPWQAGAAEKKSRAS
ncbi:hypothetical protein [Paracidovorax anthurii]|uniref:hypothetical protein n=1 Tax=Paracidovorax anthurii TaxID=78229 RepID=UPI001B869296|nr:hypothetical protein [Paracidovorax anthurii]